MKYIERKTDVSMKLTTRVLSGFLGCLSRIRTLLSIKSTHQFNIQYFAFVGRIVDIPSY